MPKGKRIVVDASVARSAGDKPVPDFMSSQCRLALSAILKAQHRLALSSEGLTEWRKHRSRFARSWLVQMFSRKLVELMGDVRDDALRHQLRSCALSDSKWRAMEKDAHLVEAALRADRIVISRDERVRALFRAACPSIRELRDILWANPEIEVEQVISWLEAGTKLEVKRKLEHG
jgi:hypothetical protein